MDILDIKPSTISVEIKHPATGEPVGLTVECVSLESDEVKAVERLFKTKALRGGRNAMTAEVVEKNTLAMLSAAIVGWNWSDGMTLGGEPDPALTKTNKERLLSISWIAKQIDDALGDEASFFASSATP